MCVDKNRAEQILKASEKIEVHHQGKPIWIEGINENTANVTVVGTCHTMDVPFKELQEG